MTAARIRELNDAFRRSFSGGRVVCSAAVHSTLPIEKVGELLRLVQRFDTFNAANDPHAEHDFGEIDFDGERYFWKIDYYDRALRFGSENPADPEVTTRVLTVMLASDY